MSIGTKKFRPYFSESELLEIIKALKENPSPNRISLIRYLELFSLKIERGISEPAVVLEGSKKEQLVQSLGFAPPNELNIDPQITYYKWQKNPASCSPAELEAVNQYRWENKYMTEEESRQYEQSLFNL